MKKQLKDKYFVVDKKGKFLSKAFAFTCPNCFEDDIYSEDTEAAAQATITTKSLADCSVIDIPRFVDVA